ncbi:hypothetical protein L7F22_012559 [Adiantum nelumboides]|nr:hypothetical protein [Adiantum nelumboides]
MAGSPSLHSSHPTTDTQLVATVAAAVEKKQKMKDVVSNTRDYNQGLLIDKETMTMVADSGIELCKQLDVIAAQGLALKHASYWQGLSLGGGLSTSAHGSSFFGKRAAVHELVLGMRLVMPASHEEGFAKVLNLTDS